MSEIVDTQQLKKIVKPSLKRMSKNQLIDIIVELGAKVSDYKAALASQLNKQTEESKEEQSND